MYTLEDVVRVAETLPKDQVNGWWAYDADQQAVRYDSRDGAPTPAFCSYEDKHDTSKPSCIAGHIVFGLDPELFQRLVDDGDGWDDVGVARAFDYYANRFMASAQSEADRGMSWGDAISEAKVRLSDQTYV